MPKQYQCVVCNKRTKPPERRHVKPSVKRYLEKKLFITVTSSDIICSACRFKYYVTETQLSKKKTESSYTHQKMDDTTKDPDYVPAPATTRTKPFASPPSVTLKIPSTSSSHSRCFVCKKPGPKLVNLSAEGRFNVFLHHNILIPADSRCCPVHIQDGQLDPIAATNIHFSDNTQLNRSTILELVQQMRQTCLRQNRKLNFDSLPDDDFVALTGLTRAQFDDVCSHVMDKVKNTPSRSTKTTVGIFLLKLSSGISNKLLSTIFSVSKSSIRRAVSTVRQALMRGFVPLYLGIDSLTREKVIHTHTRPLANSLFNAEDNQMILVLDGTYIYLQKSGNFQFQRRSFSMHKGRPLVKPMVVVTTTGYFVTIVGPYLADGKNNDSAILNHMLQTNIEDIKSFVNENDIFVVDRGFRDSISLLKDLGIRAEMPSFLTKGQKQMSTEDANSTRFVTKIRWVVESANARIKRWKYLDHVLPTNQVPFIGDFVRIVCAISNKYFKPLSSPSQLESDEQLARQMQCMSLQINTLKDFVEETGLERKKKVWVSAVEADIMNFPRLNDEQLRHLTCGIYQLHLAPSYIQEHLDGNCDIHFHIDEPYLITVKMQSRHISSKKYMLWIRYTDTEITAWYCKCRAGARVVGMCSHIASVIWYLASARYEVNPKGYGVRNWGDYLADASDLPLPIDDSSSESEASDL